MQNLEQTMTEQSSTLTSKGQVTIPVAIRRLLGVGPKDKISFEVEQGTVRIKRRGSVVEQTAGALRSSQPRVSPEQERAATEQAIAEEVVARMGS
jgi:AbrB family looped-hinge helix DNA binding protein